MKQGKSRVNGAAVLPLPFLTKYLRLAASSFSTNSFLSDPHMCPLGYWRQRLPNESFRHLFDQLLSFQGSSSLTVFSAFSVTPFHFTSFRIAFDAFSPRIHCFRFRQSNPIQSDPIFSLEMKQTPHIVMF
uniref:Uncharacterized protein n=1 Tax=Caenorhabditis japonica TaxID=281687 RepID=A0A8R1EHW2_CAEJA